MSELKPCPFCGSPVHIKRDAASGLGDFVCADGAPCRGSKLIVAFPLENEALAIEAWNRRAQTAQAVPASCGECGKKTSDGWALYCVACMEKAGLPAVTDSPPLMHSCTLSLGKTHDSTARKGPAMTNKIIEAAVRKAGFDWEDLGLLDRLAFGRLYTIVRNDAFDAAEMVCEKQIGGFNMEADWARGGCADAIHALKEQQHG